jgi:hypothetical protein
LSAYRGLNDKEAALFVVDLVTGEVEEVASGLDRAVGTVLIAGDRVVARSVGALLFVERGVGEVLRAEPRFQPSLLRPRARMSRRAFETHGRLPRRARLLIPVIAVAGACSHSDGRAEASDGGPDREDERPDAGASVDESDSGPSGALDGGDLSEGERPSRGGGRVSEGESTTRGVHAISAHAPRWLIPWRPDSLRRLSSERWRLGAAGELLRAAQGDPAWWSR